MALDAESLAYWYLRLNGFLTITHFIVHSDAGPAQRTEVDVLGVRLPFRQELLIDPMQDDELFTTVVGKPLVAIVEVKLNDIAINATWRRMGSQNAERIVKAIGIVPPTDVAAAAQSLYESGAYDDARCRVVFVGVGTTKAKWVSRQLPDALQITWDHIAEFIFARFKRYSVQKTFHPQWDDAGHELWKLWMAQGTAKEFAAALRCVVELAHSAKTN